MKFNTVLFVNATIGFSENLFLVENSDISVNNIQTMTDHKGTTDEVTSLDLKIEIGKVIL